MAERIIKVGLAYIRDRKVLMARTRGKKAFYFLGGKPLHVEDPSMEKEDDITCLRRECFEEAGVRLEPHFVWIGNFSAEAHDRPGVEVELRLWQGWIVGEEILSAEVDLLRYMDRNTIKPEELTAAAKLGLDALASQGLIT